LPEYRLERPVINGRQSARWYIVWSEGGRSRRVSARTSDRRIAERFLAEFESYRSQPPATFTVADLVEGYLAEKPGERHHAKAILTFFGPLTLPNLSRAKVRAFHAARRREGATDSTINRQARVLRAALAWGAKEGWLTNPPHIDAPTPSPSRQRFLTRDEAVQLYAAAVSPHLRVFIALALYSGQRKAAILELKWSDVRNGMIWFRQVSHNKRRPVALPITAGMALALGLARMTSTGTHIISYRGREGGDLKKAFARTVELAGLEDVRIHDLRRTAASWMVQNGATFAQVAAVLNDRVETVQKHYAIFSAEFIGDALNKIG
jgi:integrase